MPGNDLPNFLSVIAIVLTAVVVVFASFTVRDGRAIRADTARGRLRELLGHVDAALQIAASSDAPNYQVRMRALEDALTGLDKILPACQRATTAPYGHERQPAFMSARDEVHQHLKLLTEDDARFALRRRKSRRR